MCEAKFDVQWKPHLRSPLVFQGLQGPDLRSGFGIVPYSGLEPIRPHAYWYGRPSEKMYMVGNLYYMVLYVSIWSHIEPYVTIWFPMVPYGSLCGTLRSLFCVQL